MKLLSRIWSHFFLLSICTVLRIISWHLLTFWRWTIQLIVWSRYTLSVLGKFISNFSPWLELRNNWKRECSYRIDSQHVFDIICLNDLNKTSKPHSMLLTLHGRYVLKWWNVGLNMVVFTHEYVKWLKIV